MRDLKLRHSRDGKMRATNMRNNIAEVENTGKAAMESQNLKRTVDAVTGRPKCDT